MYNRCNVPQCLKPTKIKGEISMHKLPTNIVNRKKWVNALKLNGKHISSGFYVCSSHFRPDDFLPRNGQKCMSLKRGSVPSQNIPRSSIQSKEKVPRKYPKERTNLKDKCDTEKLGPMSQDAAVKNVIAGIENDENVCIDNELAVDDFPNEINLDLEIEEDEDDELSVVEEAEFKRMEQETIKTFTDQCIQVNTMHDFKFSESTFIDFLRNDSDLCSFTGINSFDLLNRITFCLRRLSSAASVVNSLQIPVEVAIVLVFTKLKTNLTYRQIAILFKIHPATVSDIFSKLIPILRVVLSVAIFWPTKEQNAANIPKCFKPDFEDCRAICDCTETEIQKLKSISSRIKTYSHYKGKNTLKFQLTINPFGLITHASSAYGGKASDKYIFLDTGVLDKLEQSDGLMVDKGHAIASEVSAKGVRLIIPPTCDQPQLSAKDAVLNTSIAKSRVHVEQSIERVKKFKNFQEKIPVHMLKHIDDIIVIVGSIVNLSAPILADVRF